MSPAGGGRSQPQDSGRGCPPPPTLAGPGRTRKRTQDQGGADPRPGEAVLGQTSRSLRAASSAHWGGGGGVTARAHRSLPLPWVSWTRPLSPPRGAGGPQNTVGMFSVPHYGRACCPTPVPGNRCQSGGAAGPGPGKQRPSPPALTSGGRVAAWVGGCSGSLGVRTVLPQTLVSSSRNGQEQMPVAKYQGSTWTPAELGEPRLRDDPCWSPSPRPAPGLL